MSTRKEKGCVINNGVLTKYAGSARKVVIPASVTKIDSGAFYKCPKVKFHAPAGSYAETCAKKLGIPFVAE